MNRHQRVDRGSTLMEILVVIAVIGLLVAILIPAVQQVRGAARKTQCLNNMKQMGLAVQGYALATSALPATNSNAGFSIHVTLLPYMEQISLYNAINLTPGYILAQPQNLTCSTRAIATMLCPADSAAQPGNTSYAGNAGAGICPAGFFGACDNGGLPFFADQTFGYAAIKDGATTTATMSEWVTGEGRSNDPLRAIYTLPTHYDTFAPFAAACNGAVQGMVGPQGKGGAWMWGTMGETIYNHDMIINGKSCMNNWAPVTSAWTASSLHGGGATVLFADGHGSFIKSTMNIGVWRALGTRAGGEVVSDDSY